MEAFIATVMEQRQAVLIDLLVRREKSRVVLWMLIVLCTGKRRDSTGQNYLTLSRKIRPYLTTGGQIHLSTDMVRVPVR